MKEKKDKTGKKKKTLKSSLKAVTTAALLAGGFLTATPSPAEAKTKAGNIQERVRMVRSALQQKLDADQADNKLSYSEIELTQWGNWPNWGNWANWQNWNNWNNWRNWGNWGNR